MKIKVSHHTGIITKLKIVNNELLQTSEKQITLTAKQYIINNGIAILWHSGLRAYSLLFIKSKKYDFCLTNPSTSLILTPRINYDSDSKS